MSNWMLLLAILGGVALAFFAGAMIGNAVGYEDGYADGAANRTHRRHGGERRAR